MQSQAFTVAIVGADGAGKTTICRRLCETLPWPAVYMYMGINQDACNVLLPTTRLWMWCKKRTGRHRSMGGPKARDFKRRRGFWPTVKSLARTFNLLAEERHRQWVCQRAVRRGQIVLMDRHFLLDYYAHDVAPDAQDRTLASRLHGWMLKRYPLPDLVILLDTATASLYGRKQEGTLESLEFRRQEYLALRSMFPHFVVLDAGQPLDVVAQQAEEAIAAFRATREPASVAEKDPAGERRTAASPLSSPALTVTGNGRMDADGISRSAAALVVGLDSYTGLQTTRVLRRRGIQVIATAEKRDHFGCRTRFCHELIEAPTRTERLIEVLEERGRKLDHPAVLFPCVDMSVLLISKHRERLAPYYKIALPSHATVERLLDKTRFSELAASHGLKTPRSVCLRQWEDVERAVDTLTFPCVLKPAVKTRQWEAQVKTKVFRLQAPRELFDAYSRYSKFASEMIVQEWVEGADSELYTCYAYFDRRSEPLVSFVSRKLRQWPPGIGVASLAEECRNEELLRTTIALFQAVEFHGLAYLEAKRDARTGEWLAIEANVGRPTGRSTMAEAAGVELHDTIYRDLLGLPLPQAREQRYSGLKWIYWRQDLQSAWRSWNQGNLTLSDWWRSLRGRKVEAVFAWSDPLPFLADVWNSMRKRRVRRAEAAVERSPSLVGTGGSPR